MTPLHLHQRLSSGDRPYVCLDDLPNLPPDCQNDPQPRETIRTIHHRDNPSLIADSYRIPAGLFIH